MIQRISSGILASGIRVLLMLLLAAAVACQQASPSPTAAPAKPAEVKPTAAPPQAAAPTAAAAQAAAPTAAAQAPAQPARQGDRVVFALGQFGTESPFPWKISASETALWAPICDWLIMRDPKTFEPIPGLATSWTPSPDYKTWTFKLRQGIQFHENYGEFTSDDVRFTIEQHLKPDATGGSVGWFKNTLERLDTPDKYTVVLNLKAASWEVPSVFAPASGYQCILSKKQIETVGLEKAALSPVGTGPFRHVEGRQGDYHRFEAVPNHWRMTAGFKELIIRRVVDPAARVAGIRAGDIDIGEASGDYLDQGKRAGLKVIEQPNAGPYWVVLSGQTLPKYEDYCPTCPWAGDPNDPKSQENARKVRLALNLAVNKKAIIDGLWRGYGNDGPMSYWYFPNQKGFSESWKIPPYDPQQAKQLLAEAGYPNGFEIKVNPMVFGAAADGPDVMEAVALDWERVGVRVKRVKEDFGSFVLKIRQRKTNQTAWIYSGPSYTEPGETWGKVLGPDAPSDLLADREAFFPDVQAIMRELDPVKRTSLTRDFGQKLYDGYYGVMIGWKTLTRVAGKKVAGWTPLNTPYENSYETLTWSGQ